MEETKFLYGASGHCKVIIDILNGNNVKIKAIFDDNPRDKQLNSIPVFETDQLKNLTDGEIIVSIGDNKTRKKIASLLKLSFFTAIHKSAIISETSSIGEGTVIMPNAVVNADSVIGKHCIINTSAVIEHDCKINDYVHISPQVALAGNVTVGEGTHIGIGASVIQGIIIGIGVTIGAGAVIINDVPDYAVVVGNPGNIIKYNLDI
ncbi:acetyltransferase [Flavobacterium sp. UW10123]|uniref:acetyltransferase n=1 Tax=Flavobacterium sp. UW10123 TaxID=3230800 RepID=UPI00339A9C95